MIRISTKDILRQLHADLIGKDSYRGVTLTYSWLANQLGHLTLGFIPTLLIHALYVRYPSIHNPEFYAALTISGIWLAFEIYNFLGPLLKKGDIYTFKPAWTNVGFDTFTDVCFFTLGSFFAAHLVGSYYLIPWILDVLLIILIYPVYYWFTTKMYLQVPQYPFQFRLSQWKYSISDADKKVVSNFLNNDKSGKHLFVYGARNTGKTGLCVGIATELSIKHHACVYTTAMKLYNMFDIEQKGTAPDTALWSWKDTTLLIIDDINPCYPAGMEKELVTPEIFLEFLDTFSPHNDENRKIIRDKNIIWVLGNECNDLMHNKWRDMLIKIGVQKDDIVSIDLKG
jgi:hypothetical protein